MTMADRGQFETWSEYAKVLGKIESFEITRPEFGPRRR